MLYITFFTVFVCPNLTLLLKVCLKEIFGTGGWVSHNGVVSALPLQQRPSQFKPWLSFWSMEYVLLCTSGFFFSLLWLQPQSKNTW